MDNLWEAKWIWLDLPEGTSNVYMEARKGFELDSGLLAASLHVSANQAYKVWINGDELGRGPSPSDNQWKYYDTYSVNGILRKGANSIAAVVYNFGSEPIVTEQFKGPGGFLLQLNMKTTDGDMTICTDESWKCRRSPRWIQTVSRQHQWNGFREIYLADAEDGWEQIKYNDANWTTAAVVADAVQPDSPWPRLLPRETPFLAKEIILPSSIVRVDSNFGARLGERHLLDKHGLHESMFVDASKPGSLPGVVFDFEKEVVGYLHLEIEAPEGGVVQLSYGESLELHLIDTFLMRKGMNHLSSFGRRAFRFVMISFMATPQPVYVHQCQMEFVHYPFDQVGLFESSDPLLNEIWKVGKYTAIVNSQEHIEDCPYREGSLWVGDTLVLGKVIYHTFGDMALMRKCLLQEARIQNPDGSIPGTGPENNLFLLPDFCAYWLLGVHEFWTFTADRLFLAEIWPNVRRLLEWFQDQEDEKGLFQMKDHPRWWCFIDWADYIDRRDRVTAISCLYHKILLKASELAEVMGESELSNEFIGKAKKLRFTIRETMWSDRHQAFVDCVTDEGHSERLTLQTNFMAMWTGIFAEDEAERFLQTALAQCSFPR
ncbi:MAG TPA: alpha-L-rhamnosidase N-terminal domain-containing protein [Bacilli bacterium]